MRGERRRLIIASRGSTGSSPHARGTREQADDSAGDVRFIPACAGNAGNTLVGTTIVTVHPRMRGERQHDRVTGHVGGGSSPHARGTPPTTDESGPVGRFIPACAGNALQQLALHAGLAVHPRMRGERPPDWPPSVGAGGSSPHARGTHLVGKEQRHGGRFIPACAGNALPISY